MHVQRSIAIVLILFVVAGVAVADTLFDRYGDPRDPTVLASMIGEAREEFALIDVRTSAEYQEGHIPTALNIDYREITDALADGDRDRPIVLYCRSGNRASTAESALRSIGYTQIVNFGGLRDWLGSIEQGL